MKMPSLLPQTETAAGVYEIAVGFGDLAVDRGAIVGALGYGTGAMPEHFDELLGVALTEAAERCLPRAGFRLVEAGRVAGRPELFEVGGTQFTTQKIVAGALARADRAAVFACTIGTGLEEWVRGAMALDPVQGYIADAVASAAAEALADRLHDQIEFEMARRGWRITNRYSPGYCGWSVAEQRGLFALLPAGFCGVTLSESALMHPVKSVSGIIGVGAAVKYSDYLCDACNVRDCTYRRHRERRKTPPAATGAPA